MYGHNVQIDIKKVNVVWIGPRNDISIAKEFSVNIHEEMHDVNNPFGMSDFLMENMGIIFAVECLFHAQIMKHIIGGSKGIMVP